MDDISQIFEHGLFYFFFQNFANEQLSCKSCFPPIFKKLLSDVV
jgi:hypothetical protein